MPELTSQRQIIGDENNPAMAAGQVGMMGQEAHRGGQAIEFQCDTNEEKILNATIKALNSGSLTPLIKEELRCTIQSRRLAEGKGELKVEFKSPPKKKTMSEEERARYLKRRVQNREAAQRFRQKQKDTSDMLSAVSSHEVGVTPCIITLTKIFKNWLSGSLELTRIPELVQQ
ncbi:proto-oncogene c-Fos-like [Elysia marginata]|uniref:Proto-oncogene c-Fos-like n=1 Tax=Elysia marginata TaxID=1093978 RepID=A0AAV4G0U1_9GAST|nr:proto-oncogene c-Fos-like [Elysia marginata]